MGENTDQKNSEYGHILRSDTRGHGLHLFSFKQPVYKQLALGCQIAKQLSGLNSFSLSSNKNYRLKAR